MRSQNDKWNGKQVLIIGNHPHKGEKGTVICCEKLQLAGCYGIRVDGQFNNFYVLDTKHLKEIT